MSWGDHVPQRDIDDLGRLHDELRAAERRLADQVAFLRQSEVPWSVIAEQLGISKQAAHQRFRSTRVAFQDRALPMHTADELAYIESVQRRNDAARAKHAARNQRVAPSGAADDR